MSGAETDLLETECPTFLRAVIAARGGAIESVLQGRSMGAAIPDGTRIRIASANADTWQKCRIVVCAAPLNLIAHRIVHLGQGSAARVFLITHGDGNWLCDAPILRTSVLGEVREYLSENGWRIVGPARLRPFRQITMLSSRFVYATALEWSPALALGIGRILNRLRVAPLGVWHRIAAKCAAYVRH